MKSYQKCLCPYISVLQSWTRTTTVKPENAPHAASGFTSHSLFNKLLPLLSFYEVDLLKWVSCSLEYREFWLCRLSSRCRLEFAVPRAAVLEALGVFEIQVQHFCQG